MKRRAHRDVFDLAAKAAIRVLSKHLESLTDSQLDDAHTDAQSLGTGNCWWAVFKMKAVILETIGDEKFQREPFTGDQGGS